MKITELDSSYLEKCRTCLTDEQSRSLLESNHWAHVDRAKVHSDWDALYKEISKLIDVSSPTDKNIQELVGRHHEIACRFYKPSRDAYVGMALFYAENADMKTFHNAYHPALVDFLGQAIHAFAQEKLGTVC